MTKFNKLITLSSSVVLLASVSPQLTFADTTVPASTDVSAVVAPNSETTTVPASTDVPAVVAPNSETSTVPSSDTDVPAVSTTPSESTSEQETPSPITPSDPSSNVPSTSSDSNEVKPSLENGATTNPLTNATTNSSDKDKVGTQTTTSEKKEDTDKDKKEDTDKDKKVEVPTIDGGTTSLTPDVTVPTNNPNVSAQTAADAGASQVGTTSQVTGQVVQEVSPSAPVQTETGASIVSTQNGNVVLSDGSVVAPEAVGGTVNEDKTISVTDKDGKLKTLPNTGLKESILLTFAGFGLLAIVVSFFLKKRSN
ncbi:LPXTG cell wall anchor domain-containing protein [Streptococcus oralis]|uniref:LPXTG cell wall anchor domain-containing protein n=1 Tax=Streptococcus oralis TaxID=1303 RepID=UPI0019D11797|nr:LPXTG cell wall anchor domain-containing protein [Streptococcus oralis]MBN6014389.1 LPXTG cell wall anchor domain-containing protein [Streptococcus oralis subsp. oralis]